jgi:hypothetical protein
LINVYVLTTFGVILWVMMKSGTISEPELGKEEALIFETCVGDTELLHRDQAIRKDVRAESTRTITADEKLDT